VAKLGLEIQEELTNPLCIDTTSRRNPCIVKFYQGAQKQPAPYYMTPDLLKKQPSEIAAKFLECHYKFGHISSQKILLMAKQGLLPGHLAKFPTPLCTAFVYGDQSLKKIAPYSVNPDLLKKQLSDIAAEFLEYHYKFGQISPRTIQLIDKQGLLPGYFAKFPITLCTAILYSKAYKTPWRSKPAFAAKQSATPTIPVSVAQSISSYLLHHGLLLK
jgi:hypothetical protein